MYLCVGNSDPKANDLVQLICVPVTLLVVCLCYYVDTNECGYNNGGCAQNCHNIIGSYFCTCNGSGYTLNSNRHTCDGELKLSC